MLPLDSSGYYKAKKPLEEVRINHLFARSVVEKHVPGSIYVDNAKQPETFYIIHPYGQSLLFGNPDNDAYNFELRDYLLNKYKLRNTYEWMQAFPETWNEKITELLGDDLIRFADEKNNNGNRKIEENTRVNFRFNPDKYMAFKRTYLTGTYEIIRTDREMYEKIDGKVVPKYFWRDADHFHNSGIGFSLIYNKEIASTAFSSFFHDDQLEIGIETSKDYQGKGLAAYSCSALIDYCLKNNYIPVWSCNLENTGSYKLAQKLGFEQTVIIPYYKLSV